VDGHFNYLDILILKDSECL